MPDPRTFDALEHLHAELGRAKRANARLKKELEGLQDSTAFRIGERIQRTRERLRPGSRQPDPATTTPSGSGDDEPLRPGPVTERSVLVDVTRMPAAAVPEAVAPLLEEGLEPTVVHPDRLELPGGATQIVAAHVDDAAARFGPARTYTIAPLTQGPAVIRRRPTPLVELVEEVGGSEGLPPGPVLIGGTGRSGTTVLGQMLQRHPRFVTVRTELGFHAPGFAQVLAGETSPERFSRKVMESWYEATGGRDRPKGLVLILGRHELRQCLEAFEEHAREDLPTALGQLLLDVVRPYVRGRGGLRWAESTPSNARGAGALTTVLPTARVVNTVRDGRDVAASVATMPWGPDTHLEALEWWAGRIRQAGEGLAAADPDRVHTVRFEELMALDRQATLDRLLAFLHFEDDALLRRFFERQMDGRRSHTGRWRSELDVDLRAAFDGRYRELLDEFEDEGLPGLPVSVEAADSLAT